MNVFNDVDIEFFDLKDQKPNDGEQILIVLKAGVDSGNYISYYNNNTPTILTTADTLDLAEYQIFKSVPSKFKCKTAYRRRTFEEKDIICWGRRVAS